MSRESTQRHRARQWFIDNDLPVPPELVVREPANGVGVPASRKGMRGPLNDPVVRARAIEASKAKRLAKRLERDRLATLGADALMEEFARKAAHRLAELTLPAIDTLGSVAQDSGQPGASRVTAANSILDRVYGKPVQQVDASVGPASVFAHHSLEQLLELRELLASAPNGVVKIPERLALPAGREGEGGVSSGS